jgi:phosphate transport system substrate-binding protein
MRLFSAVADQCADGKCCAPSGIARASAAAAHDLIARLAQRLFNRLRGAWLVAIVATFAMAAVGAHADSIRIGGTGTGLGAMKLLAQEFKKSRPDAQLIVTPSLGSTGAIRAVLAAAVDIGISARPVSPEEARQGASARAYARTPFAIATGAKNSSAGLSLRELVQIYSGKLTRWPDGSPIRLIVRPDADTDTIVMRTFSAEMDSAITAALARKGLRMADTDQDNADALEKIQGSLGTTTLTQIVTENRAIRLLALDGVMPTLQSLAAGDYRHFKILYLVTRRKPSPLTKDFVAFIRSPAAQAVLASSGNLALEE